MNWPRIVAASVSLVVLFTALVITEKATAPSRTEAGLVSIQLSRAVVLSRAFWRRVGGYIAWLSDFLSIFQEFFETAYRLLELVCTLAVSWLWVFCGYFDYIFSYDHPYRAAFGTCVIIFGILLALEHWTQWLNRCLNFCAKEMYPPVPPGVDPRTAVESQLKDD